MLTCLINPMYIKIPTCNNIRLTNSLGNYQKRLKSKSKRKFNKQQMRRNRERNQMKNRKPRNKEK